MTDKTTGHREQIAATATTTATGRASPPPRRDRRAKGVGRGRGTSPEGRRRQMEAMRRSPGRRESRSYGPGTRKVDYILDEEDVEPYWDLMRQPGTTLTTLLGWLRGRGYKIGPSAVRLHRHDFRAKLAQCRMASEMAKAFNDEARRHGGLSTADAAAHHAEQQMMEALFHALGAEREREEFDPERWRKIHQAVGEMAANRSRLEAARHLGPPPRGGVRRAAAGPADAGDRDGFLPLVNRVRAAVGLPPALPVTRRPEVAPGPEAG